MAECIRIRDIVRGLTRDFGPDEPILRASSDLVLPGGPIQIRSDGLAEWFKHDVPHGSRVAGALLGSVLVGERVLLRLDASEPADRWWLCDVEEVDGIAGEI
jgi:hypothetical protein